MRRRQRRAVECVGQQRLGRLSLGQGETVHVGAAVGVEGDEPALGLRLGQAQQLGDAHALPAEMVDAPALDAVEGARLLRARQGPPGGAIEAQPALAPGRRPRPPSLRRPPRAAPLSTLSTGKPASRPADPEAAEPPPLREPPRSRPKRRSTAATAPADSTRNRRRLRRSRRHRPARARRPARRGRSDAGACEGFGDRRRPRPGAEPPGAQPGAAHHLDDAAAVQDEVHHHRRRQHQGAPVVDGAPLQQGEPEDREEPSRHVQDEAAQRRQGEGDRDDRGNDELSRDSSHALSLGPRCYGTRRRAQPAPPQRL